MKSRVGFLLGFSVGIFLLPYFCHQALGQEVILKVTAQSETISTPEYFFGFSDLAQDGVDDSDSADPPPAPSDQINMAFSIPDCPPDFPNRWRRDIRYSGNLAFGSQLFQMHLESAFDFVELQFGDFQVNPGVGATRLRILDSSGETVIAVPGAYVAPISDGVSDLWIEFPLDGVVNNENQTWGGLKASYGFD